MQLSDFKPGDLVSFRNHPTAEWYDGVVKTVCQSQGDKVSVHCEKEHKDHWRRIRIDFQDDADIGLLVKRRYLYAIGEEVEIRRGADQTWTAAKVVGHPNTGGAVLVDYAGTYGPQQYDYDRLRKKPAETEQDRIDRATKPLHVEIERLKNELKEAHAQVEQRKNWIQTYLKAEDKFLQQIVALEDKNTTLNRELEITKANALHAEDTQKEFDRTKEIVAATLTYVRQLEKQLADAKVNTGYDLTPITRLQEELAQTKAEFEARTGHIQALQQAARENGAIFSSVNSALNRAGIYCALDFHEAIDLIAKERDQACADRDRWILAHNTLAGEGESIRNQTLCHIHDEFRKRLSAINDAVRAAGIVWELDTDKAVGVITWERDEARKKARELKAELAQTDAFAKYHELEASIKDLKGKVVNERDRADANYMEYARLNGVVVPELNQTIAKLEKKLWVVNNSLDDLKAEIK